MKPTYFDLTVRDLGGARAGRPERQMKMATLAIRWQRLLDEGGRTCPRCRGTQAEAEKAVRDLSRALKPLGIRVRPEWRALTWRAFKRNPAASNRIWVGGKPLERWVGGRTDQSPCCGACGDSDCRTMTVGGRSHEVIPSRLIVSAGLLAAALMLKKG